MPMMDLDKSYSYCMQRLQPLLFRIGARYPDFVSFIPTTFMLVEQFKSSAPFLFIGAARTLSKMTDEELGQVEASLQRCLDRVIEAVNTFRAENEPLMADVMARVATEDEDLN